MVSPTVNTRFLILSDTHDLNLLEYTTVSQDSGARKALPSADVVLHCGDITENGGLQQHKQAIDGLASIESELKLVIAGNHDIDLDPFYSSPETSQPVRALWNSAIDRGIYYLEEGTYSFKLSNNAVFTVHASPHTPQYGESAFQHPTGEDRYNVLSPSHARNVSTEQTLIPDNIQVLMTHGPPKHILDECADQFRSSGGCEHLRRAVYRARPQLHCFGHIHSAWGARRAQWLNKPGSENDDNLELLPLEFAGKNSSRKRGYATLSPTVYEQCRAGEQTLFVNAAVGNHNGQMENMPWLVRLNLPRAKQAYGHRD